MISLDGVLMAPLELGRSDNFKGSTVAACPSPQLVLNPRSAHFTAVMALMSPRRVITDRVATNDIIGIPNGDFMQEKCYYVG